MKPRCRSTTRRTSCRVPSWCSRLRTRSSTRGRTRCPNRSSTGSSCASGSATPRATTSRRSPFRRSPTACSCGVPPAGRATAASTPSPSSAPSPTKSRCRGDSRVTSGRRVGWWLAWPRRTLWPTRGGWWCLGAALGLGFAALNTGNNLFYLLVSMLLGLIIVSGVLSEQSIRRGRVEPALPAELFAGQAALVAARVVNRKRWRTSYSITVEVLGGGHRAYLAKLEGGGARLVTWQETPRARGRWRVAGFKVATRFPFGLFVKAAQLPPSAEGLVYPAVGPISADRRRELARTGR